MLTRRLSLVALAAAFAVSSSAALLQSARPALADADDHHPRQHQRFDRDDWRYHRNTNNNNGYWTNRSQYSNNRNGYWSNGRWYANNQTGYWNTNANYRATNWNYTNHNWNANRAWTANHNWANNRNWNNNGRHNGWRKHRDRDDRR